MRADGSWQLLRPGPVAEAELARELGPPKPLADLGIEAPGQLARHYSPGKPVRLGAREAAGDEFLIGFGAVAGDCSLSAAGDLALAAARLYACLHDGRGVSEAAHRGRADPRGRHRRGDQRPAAARRGLVRPAARPGARACSTCISA